MASCADTARDEPALACSKTVRSVIVGKCVCGSLAWSEKWLGRSSRHVGTEWVDSRIGCVVSLPGPDVEEVLLAAGDPVAVALARDGDGEAVHERDVDACHGKVPPIGARICQHCNSMIGWGQTYTTNEASSRVTSPVTDKLALFMATLPAQPVGTANEAVVPLGTIPG